jgi:hypothetical protein
MKQAKYIRTNSNICPICGTASPKTGNLCGHLVKITAKQVYFWHNNITQANPEQAFKQLWNTMGMEAVFSGGRSEQDMAVGGAKINEFCAKFFNGREPQ